MTISTRVADAGDLPALRELDRHLSPEALADVVSRGRVLVAESDAAAAGCLRWGLFWDQVPFMNLLWVVAPLRGEGIGAALVEAWERSCAAAGHALVLTSTVSAETSQHFYRRLGYVDAGALLLPDEPAELLLRKVIGRQG